jgi:hypothetical protein
MEIWKEIPDHPGYEVSSFGDVRSYWGNNGKLNTYAKPLAFIITENGYRRVAIRKGKKPRIWFVHRLVMLAFVGPLPVGHEVNHKDGLKKHNELSNLEYVTHSENEKHKYRVLKAPTAKWERSNFAKLTREQAYAIKYSETGYQYEIAKKYGVSTQTVHFIKKNKTWKDL